ncbi:hypothetical protein BH10ACT1_BH10ACT1_33740 [soil metagenome]
MTRTRSLAALAVATALMLSACGSSSSDAGSDTGSEAGGASVTSPAAAPVALAGKVNDHGTKDLSGDGATATLSMELDDDYFSPTFVQAAPGATVTVELENEGDMPHTFTLDDKSIDTKVLPGKVAKVTVTVPKSGSLRFSCDFHLRAGMQGAFYTGTGAAAPAASSTTEAARGASGY